MRSVFNNVGVTVAAGVHMGQIKSVDGDQGMELTVLMFLVYPVYADSEAYRALNRLRALARKATP